MNEQCQRCKELDPDLRTLWMACFYAMEELNLPFEKVELADKRKFYTLRVCKDCRADWMATIKSWFENPPDRNDPIETGIYERFLGSNREVTHLTRKDNS